MKFIIVFLTVLSSFSYAQTNDFNLGTKYLNEGEYKLADSLLKSYVMAHHEDRNAWYNWAITKFYLHDTLSFCKKLHTINSPYVIDKEAEKLYFNYCGTTDTTYLTKKFEPANRIKFRYYLVKEYHKYDELTRYKLHSKRKRKDITVIGMESGISSYYTDVLTIYQVDSNNNKIYSLTLNPPSFPKTASPNSTQFNIEKLLQTQYYNRQINDSLHLVGKSVNFDIIIDKQGIIKFERLNDVYPALEDTTVLVNYLKQQCNDLKRCTPARFRNEPVNYRLNLTLDF